VDTGQQRPWIDNMLDTMLLSEAVSLLAFVASIGIVPTAC